MVTCMPLQQGKVNVTTGTYTGNVILHCEVDGSLTITWFDDTTTVKAMVVGEDVLCRDRDFKSVAITSGTFTVATVSYAE